MAPAKSTTNHHVTWIVVFMLAAAIAGATPPGIAKGPTTAKCMNPEFKTCHNLEHVCPKFCPDGCTVDCRSCKPICIGSTAPPDGSDSPPDSESPNPESPPTPKPQSPPQLESPPESESPKPVSPPESESRKPESPPQPESPPVSEAPKPISPPESESPKPVSPPQPESPPVSETPKPKSPPAESPKSESPPEFETDPESRNSPPPPTPSSPSPPPSTPMPTPTTPSPPAPTPTPSVPSPPSATPSSPSPPPSTPSPTTPSPPSTTPSSPPQTPTPSSSPTWSSPPSSTPSSPPQTPTPSSSPPTWSSPPSSTPPTAAKKAKCKNKNYPLCYSREYVCPNSCPGECVVDCVSCKPVCKCDMPGAVCQDPRFIGGDGITFYFHGKKDQDFCLVSDTSLHINGHFIGRRNHHMKRDFTWVQSVAILFSNHKLVISAQKTSSWDDTVDRVAVTLDQKTIILPETEGSKWQSQTMPMATISRISDTNNVLVEVEGLFKITAKVVPITSEESRIHNYGITADDCFAHLDLGFKFFSLSDEVNGVLGQTYRSDYVSQVKMGVLMPVMGGDRKFSSSSLTATDCSVARFKSSNGYDGEASLLSMELPSLSCESGFGGQAGVICKR